MQDSIEYWSEKIQAYRQKNWANQHSIFAEDVKRFLPETGSLLELGCGLGYDGLWFVGNGYDVTQVDLSDFRSTEAKNIPFQQIDMSKSLDIPEKFDIIYAHLSVHYFSKQRTKGLFAELSDLLKESGFFAFLVNSVHDPEYSKGEKIEEDYFNYLGIPKRYFDKKSAKELTEDLFVPLMVDEKGTSHKDKADGLYNLVRFVGRKI